MMLTKVSDLSGRILIPSVTRSTYKNSPVNFFSLEEAGIAAHSMYTIYIKHFQPDHASCWENIRTALFVMAGLNLS